MSSAVLVLLCPEPGDRWGGGSGLCTCMSVSAYVLGRLSVLLCPEPCGRWGGGPSGLCICTCMSVSAYVLGRLSPTMPRALWSLGGGASGLG